MNEVVEAVEAGEGVEEGLSVEGFRETAARIEAEVGKVIVGQRDVVRHVLIGVLSGGHVLLEGVPGLGKTMLIRTLGQALELQFSRIQFTPDLMPADITGTDIMEEADDGRRAFRFQKGPVFANLILADEINRATPKTQSALLEAMQEQTVTVTNRTYPLPAPFFVMATQNPLEMEGTYPLPEAQLDRFVFKVDVPFPSAGELSEIMDRTTGGSEPTAEPVADGVTLTSMQLLARQVPIPSQVNDYVSRFIVATHPAGSPAQPVNDFVRYGASPRGGQAMVLGAKITALLAGRYNVSFEDVTAVAPAALRHRLLLNFEGQAQGIAADDVIASLIRSVPREP
jgi:MoxR-like ATPase